MLLRRHPATRLFSSLSSVVLSLMLSSTGYAQRPATPTPRVVMVETNRKEMDSLLMRKPIPATEDKSARRELLKRINEDFRGLQVVNNKIMIEITAQQQLDYRFVSRAIGEIASRAGHLKTNIALPKVDSKNKSRNSDEISGVDAFKSAVFLLDRMIGSFTTNPLFQNANVIDVDLANKASEDLNDIIALSGTLKKVAEKLGKNASK